MDFSAYEKGNPFMSYNHIQICKVDPDCCVVKVNLVAESMNLHGISYYLVKTSVSVIGCRAHTTLFRWQHLQ